MLHVKIHRSGLILMVLGLILMVLGVVSLAQAATAGTVFTYDGHSYEIVKTPLTWSEAASEAAGRKMHGVSGYLVRIDSEAENQEILDQLITAIPSSEYSKTSAPDGGGGAYAWIGATDWLDEGDWMWDGEGKEKDVSFWSGGKNGSPVDDIYSNWGTVDSTQNEPDNWGDDQNAAGISLNGWPISDQHLGVAGQWNDVKMSNRLFYVVEYNAMPESNGWMLIVAVLLLVIIAILVKSSSKADPDAP